MDSGKVQQRNLHGQRQAGVDNVLAARYTIGRQIRSQRLAEVGNKLAARYRIGRQSRSQESSRVQYRKQGRQRCRDYPRGWSRKAEVQDQGQVNKATAGVQEQAETIQH